MVNVLDEWHDEHVRFNHLLDILGNEVAAFHAGDNADYQLMRDILCYLHYFADAFHHPRENAAFQRLVEREPGLSMAVNRLLQEHRVIATAGETLLRHLEEINADVVIPRTYVEAAAATYLAYYRHHLTAEESEILPRAAAIMTPEDWAVVAAAIPVRRDPLFGENAIPGYEALRRHIEAGAQHLILRAPARVSQTQSGAARSAGLPS